MAAQPPGMTSWRHLGTSVVSISIGRRASRAGKGKIIGKVNPSIWCVGGSNRLLEAGLVLFATGFALMDGLWNGWFL